MRKVIEASGVFCPKCHSDNVFIDFGDDLCNCQSCEYSWYISSGKPIEHCMDHWDEKNWGKKPKRDPYEIPQDVIDSAEEIPMNSDFPKFEPDPSKSYEKRNHFYGIQGSYMYCVVAGKAYKRPVRKSISAI